MKKQLLFFFSMLLFGSQISKAQLVAGDIAIIGVNEDAGPVAGRDHSFTFIALTDIPASEVIYFTEAGVNLGTNTWVNTSEGHYSWTAPAVDGLSCGSIVHFWEDGATNVVVATTGTVSGLLGASTAWNTSGGDQILIYQAPTGQPANFTATTFITGSHLDDGSSVSLPQDPVTKWTSTTVTGGGANASHLPPGLTNGVNCVSLFITTFSEQDNVKYTGTLTGTSTALRASINDRTNWSTHNSTPFDISPAGYSPSVTCAAPCTDPTVPTVTASPSSICSGSTTTLTISGTLNDATAWHVYTGTCGGTAVGTTAGGTFTSAALTGNTTFYVRGEGGCVTPGACGASATVTVNSLSVAPTGITGTTTICHGESTTLTLSGGSAGTGATAQWFSTSCGTGSVGTGNSVTVSPSSTATYYVRYSGTCNTTLCASTAITVSCVNWTGAASTNWDISANWQGSVIPDATKDVTIPSAPSNQPHVTSAPGTPAACNNITVESGATLTIDAGKALTVSGNLANAGTVDIKADVTGIGSLITNGTVSGAGSFKMEQYLTGSGGATPDGLFYYVSSAIPNATSTNYGIPATGKLWIDQEPTQTYAELTFGGIPLDVGQGYVARMGANTTVAFDGSSYNTGTIVEGSLTRTGTSETNRGYNLVGNPYPSTVSWNGASRTNLETTMYYRTHNGSTMLFDTYNATDPVGTSNNGTPVTGNIAPGQAFWVRVPTDGQTGSITFDNADRSHGTLAGLLKPAAEEGMLRLKLSNGTISDEQIIRFNPSALATYEDYDSQKYWSEDVPQLYSTVATDTLTINGLNNPIATPTVDLGIKVPAQGAYTLNATSITFTETPVYLEDVELNVLQNLNTNPVYNFTSEAGNIGDRFVLHFSELTGVDETETSIQVFSNGNQIHVQLSKPENGTLSVTDMSGRTIYKQQIVSDKIVVNLNTAAGVYIVKVKTSESLIARKVIIQ
jgi:hypothetical protein